ncbi:MAG: WbqC family protein, partial [Candidatus Doudnabacteria bacterium]
GADTYISGIGGRNYLIEDMFVTQGIKLEYLSFHHPAYKQRYPGFIPDLSSLDYIMNVDAKIDSPGY